MVSIEVSSLPNTPKLAKPATSEAPAPKTVESGKQIAKLQASLSEVKQATSSAGEEISRQKSRVQEAIERLNAHMITANKQLSFAIDDVSNRMVISVVNQESGEVIRQIPDKSILKIAENIESLKGILFEKDL